MRGVLLFLFTFFFLASSLQGEASFGFLPPEVLIQRRATITSFHLNNSELFTLPGATPIDQRDPFSKITENFGFCWEGYLNNYSCTDEVLRLGNQITDGPILHSLSDAEENLTLATLSALGSEPIKGDDIVFFEDGLATLYSEKIPVIQNENKQFFFESPVALYRKEGGYLLSGYLAMPKINSSPIDSDYDQLAQTYHNKPKTILSANLVDPQEPTEAQGLKDLVVTSSAPWPENFIKKLKDELLTNDSLIPHESSQISMGLIWMRASKLWHAPHKMFRPQYAYLVGTESFDSALGHDRQFSDSQMSHPVFFIPSNRPTKDGECFIYKFMEEGWDPIFHELKEIPPLLPGRAIKATPPTEGYCPYKIATHDINRDGFSDFAITWAKDEHFDAYYSLFLTSFDQNEGLIYTQQDYGVPYPLKTLPLPMNDKSAKLSGIKIAELEYNDLGETRRSPFIFTSSQEKVCIDGICCAYNYYRLADGIISNEVGAFPVSECEDDSGGLSLEVSNSGDIFTLIGNGASNNRKITKTKLIVKEPAQFTRRIKKVEKKPILEREILSFMKTLPGREAKNPEERERIRDLNQRRRETCAKANLDCAYSDYFVGIGGYLRWYILFPEEIDKETSDLLKFKPFALWQLSGPKPKNFWRSNLLPQKEDLINSEVGLFISPIDYLTRGNQKSVQPFENNLKAELQEKIPALAKLPIEHFQADEIQFAQNSGKGISVQYNQLLNIERIPVKKLGNLKLEMPIPEEWKNLSGALVKIDYRIPPDGFSGPVRGRQTNPESCIEHIEEKKDEENSPCNQWDNQGYLRHEFLFTQTKSKSVALKFAKGILIDQNKASDQPLVTKLKAATLPKAQTSTPAASCSLRPSGTSGN